MSTAAAQHEAYCEALSQAGLAVTCLPPLDEYPDSTFVEDTAIVTAYAGAILTRPGAVERRGEAAAMRDALLEFYPSIETIEAPGTLDGGDVCQAGDHFFIGISARTNPDGARQLARFLAVRGHTTTPVEIGAESNLLHLKSGLSYIGDGRVLLDRSLASHDAFRQFDSIVVERKDAYAANCVRINAHLLLAAGYPHLEERLDGLGYTVISVPMSEFRKMDGGLSCLSLRF